MKNDVPYKTLKFYCDWLLHTQKDRVHPEMKQYIYFEELKRDLDKILSDKGMPKKILEGGIWLNLIRVIAKLLKDQPLMNPVDEVKSIVFAPSAEGAAIVLINFSEPVLDRDQKPLHYYKMGNFY